MKRSLLLAIALPFFAALLFAQTAREAQPRALLNELAATIQTELQSHGERVLGHETYRWSTRLEKMADCRAELSVRVTSNLGETVIRTESVSFSLGALHPHSIELQKNWLQLPCAGGANCIISTSTSSRKTKDGMVLDCTTASQKRVDSFALQLDGDADASLQLERAFRKAVDACRAPIAVTF
jgi:hypothetical protein